MGGTECLETVDADTIDQDDPVDQDDQDDLDDLGDPDDLGDLGESVVAAVVADAVEQF